MKKTFVIITALIMIAGFLAGCASSEEQQIKSVAANFLRAKANLDYKTIKGTEGSQYTTAKAQKKLKDEAEQQAEVYRSAQGKTFIVGTPKLSITKKEATEAVVESNFKLKATSLVNSSGNGIKNYSFRATLKKEANRWLVDSWGFAPK